MEPLDWGEGDYARTAATLEPAAERLVEFAGVRADHDVLDVACGTGNAALESAARGATVTGVDPAGALIEQARTRAADQGIEARWLEGDADALPLPDDAVDVALSVFGVIFAPDPAAVAAELARVVRPGGTLALTAWKPGGPINAIGRLIFQELDAPAGPPRNWGDAAWVEELLVGAGARNFRFEETTLSFTAPSAEGWWEDQAGHHPVWLWARRQMGEDAWTELRRRGIEALEQANEDPSAFRTTSGYLLAAASR